MFQYRQIVCLTCMLMTEWFAGPVPSAVADPHQPVTTALRKSPVEQAPLMAQTAGTPNTHQQVEVESSQFAAREASGCT